MALQSFSRADLIPDQAMFARIRRAQRERRGPELDEDEDEDEDSRMEEAGGGSVKEEPREPTTARSGRSRRSIKLESMRANDDN